MSDDVPPAYVKKRLSARRKRLWLEQGYTILKQLATDSGVVNVFPTTAFKFISAKETIYHLLFVICHCLSKYAKRYLDFVILICLSQKEFDLSYFALLSGLGICSLLTKHFQQSSCARAEQGYTGLANKACIF